MLFPIGDDQVKGGTYPLFSYAFIVLNAVVFWQQLSQPDAWIYEFGAIPVEIMQGKDTITLITSMFLHGGWMHLIGNMLFLWVFADNIEATIGNVRFVIFYLLGGLAAHAAHIYFNSGSSIPTVGASGAISAVMGAYLIMFPASRVKVWFFFFTFRVPALLFLGFWIWQQWMSGMASLDVATAESSGVAWWAHIGGFVFGVVAGFYYRMRFSPTLDRGIPSNAPQKQAW
ncbi:MAG TPA: rhomboid family intramembrane serine protease [Saprospiraceae bacterium]|nr:rhomboid family intramembrane serine protease [Saprospiraceae bacterium]HMQ84431.1 rhomboid family intramembrane serine protease [Saprospiraceae bacterium]